MTWKRELAFWTFMFFVAIGFLGAIVKMGVYFTGANW